MLFLLFNIITMINHFYNFSKTKEYLRKVESLPEPIFINDYEDELIKLSNDVSQEIFDNFINSYGDTFEYEFNINCIEYYDNNLCDEYIRLKYNMSLEQLEDNVVNYMYYIFNNISIYKEYQNNDICCNTYKLIWQKNRLF